MKIFCGFEQGIVEIKLPYKAIPIEGKNPNNRPSMEARGCLKYLVAIVVNYEKSKRILKYVPHRRFHDLAVMYRMLRDGAYGEIGCDMTYGLMKKFKLTEPELFRIAYQNMKGKEIVQDVSRCGHIPNYLITNKGGIKGAGYIIFKDIFRKIAEKHGSDIYIVPSSIHELLVSVANRPIENVLDNIHNMNRLIAPENFLSDSCYYYNRDLDEILFFS